jgi:hypothetical protein
LHVEFFSMKRRIQQTGLTKQVTPRPLPFKSFTNQTACTIWRIGMDIGWRIAYKRAAPNSGAVNGGIKSHGEETQEGQENRSEKVAQDKVVVVAGLS